jgi:hypothetical protein
MLRLPLRISVAPPPRRRPPQRSSPPWPPCRRRHRRKREPRLLSLKSRGNPVPCSRRSPHPPPGQPERPGIGAHQITPGFRRIERRLHHGHRPKEAAWPTDPLADELEHVGGELSQPLICTVSAIGTATIAALTAPTLPMTSAATSLRQSRCRLPRAGVDRAAKTWRWRSQTPGALLRQPGGFEGSVCRPLALPAAGSASR